MVDAVETMAYTGEVPWHGLGSTFEKGASVDEVLRAAKLDWTVEKLPLVAETVNDTTVPLTEHFGLIRNRNGVLDPLGICGKEYTPTQNAEAFTFFTEFCESGGMTMETAGSLMGGRQIFGLARLNRNFALPGDDLVESYLLLSHPHIWGKALVTMLTPIRVVCMNTLNYALRQGGPKFVMTHRTRFDIFMQNEAKKTLGLALNEFETFHQGAEFLSKKEYTDESLFKYIAEFMQPDLLEANEDIKADMLKRNGSRVLYLVNKGPGAELPSSKNTWWGAFNAVTRFYDYDYGQTADARLTSAWFGANASKKRNAFDRAIEYAKAA